MRGLKGLFARKIIITAALMDVPLLFFPPSLFAWLGVPSPQPLILVRLLGVAYCALLMGYYSGIKAIEASPLQAAGNLPSRVWIDFNFAR